MREYLVCVTFEKDYASGIQGTENYVQF